MRVAPEHVAILARSTFNGNALVLPEQLDRRDYVAVNKALEAAGGAWNRRAGAHVFHGLAAEAIEPILMTGEITCAKQEFDFFPSPPPVVARLLELTDVPAGCWVLEPSAGDGAIVRAVRDHQRACRIAACELLDGNIAKLRTEGLVDSLRQADFLSVEPVPVYDRVIMNPPFSGAVDIDHVMHAVKFLSAGGRLVSVMSAGVKFRETAKHRAFRDFLEQREAHVEDLPEGAFKASGTMVRTIVVAFDVA